MMLGIKWVALYVLDRQSTAELHFQPWIGKGIQTNRVLNPSYPEELRKGES